MYAEATTSGDLERLLEGVPSHKHSILPARTAPLPPDPRLHVHKVPLLDAKDTEGEKMCVRMYVCMFVCVCVFKNEREGQVVRI